MDEAVRKALTEMRRLQEAATTAAVWTHLHSAAALSNLSVNYI